MNDRSLGDALKRAIRTFVQGAVGVLMLTAIGPLNELVTGLVSGNGHDAKIDLDIWRNIALAAMAGGFIALITFLHNALEDKVDAFPTMLKPVDRDVGDQVLGEQP